ncbi:voltage-gated chloride channel family protein [Comamonas koreensis]|uniref:Voltage-gated chloride channel family protein n=1 Tax=Comamonas koreensis TaxID=160825 RepID=A0AAW4XWC9_9BURK|nr:voltage-gated chloride channel family protein [Comamonas koreensis]MCD2165029.1 voltage-gated chloride channel family protein [Comamonas koreensis]
MPKLSSFAPLALLPHLGKWLLLSAITAALAGTASAFLLFALDAATAWRDSHRWLVWLLPLAGLAVGWVYQRLGQAAEGGVNLLMEEVHAPNNTLPLRMVPLALVSTVVSHLFGASVGREGTAVQMGGALADQLSQRFRVGAQGRPVVLMAGISAGFASVFGTPLAGAVFGMEVVAIGRMRYEALFPCVVAAILADQVSLAWGVQHTHYALGVLAPMGWWPVTAVAFAGMLFGLVGMLFAAATRSLGGWMKRWITCAPMRPFIGGVVIAVAAWACDAYRYLGLGIPEIVQAFQQPVLPWDFVGKLLMTVASIGSGFKGGEVTPLFYIGATLGNALAPLLQMPVGMMAGLGFVAVFAGAANTPIATTLMALELFGPQIGPFAAMACMAAYLFSGHAGIYHAQRIAQHKYGQRKD